MSEKSSTWQDPETGRVHIFRTSEDCIAFFRARAALHEAKPAPQVIRDELDYVRSPVDGKRYTSKRLYEKSVRQQGCQIVGNEAEKLMEKGRPEYKHDPVDVVEDIKRAYQELESK